MFAGFQSNAFQSSGFQILAGSESPVVVVGGHFADFKGYRKRLESMLKAAEARDEALYRKESAALVESATELERDLQLNVIISPALEKTKPVDIDFSSVITELNRLLLRIERAAERQKLMSDQKRGEEELIFLLALQ